MNIDKDGKVDIFTRHTLKIFEEFGWNVEEMADAISDLRKELEEKEKELERANDAINDR